MPRQLLLTSRFIVAAVWRRAFTFMNRASRLVVLYLSAWCSRDSTVYAVAPHRTITDCLIGCRARALFALRLPTLSLSRTKLTIRKLRQIVIVATLTKVMLRARTCSLNIEADFFILIFPGAYMNADLLLSENAGLNLTLVFLEHLPKLVYLLSLLLSALIFGFFFQFVNEFEQGQVDFLALQALVLN